MSRLRFVSAGSNSSALKAVQPYKEVGFVEAVLPPQIGRTMGSSCCWCLRA